MIFLLSLGAAFISSESPVVSSSIDTQPELSVSNALKNALACAGDLTPSAETTFWKVSRDNVGPAAEASETASKRASGVTFKDTSRRAWSWTARWAVGRAAVEYPARRISCLNAICTRLKRKLESMSCKAGGGNGVDRVSCGERRRG